MKIITNMKRRRKRKYLRIKKLMAHLIRKIKGRAQWEFGRMENSFKRMLIKKWHLVEGIDPYDLLANKLGMESCTIQKTVRSWEGKPEKIPTKIYIMHNRRYVCTELGFVSIVQDNGQRMLEKTREELSCLMKNYLHLQAVNTGLEQKILQVRITNKNLHVHLDELQVKIDKNKEERKEKNLYWSRLIKSYKEQNEIFKQKLQKATEDCATLALHKMQQKPNGNRNLRTDDVSKINDIIQGVDWSAKRKLAKIAKITASYVNEKTK